MEVKRLFDTLYYQQENYPQQVALSHKTDTGWKSCSTAEFIAKVNKVSRALHKYGIVKGDKIGLVSENRPEWNYVDLGMLQLGAVNVPVYPNILPEEYQFIFSDSEIRILFVSTKALFSRIKPIVDKLPKLEKIYCFDDIKGIENWESLLDTADKADGPAVEQAMQNVDEKDLATIIYTSGTTGTPKGVMLSHRNIVENFKAVAQVIPISNDHKTISFLPLCHIFERTATYLFMYVGAGIYYAESMEKIAENIKEVKPHYFTTVPRLLEKVYEKIMGKRRDLTGIKARLFDWSIDLGLKYEPNKKQSGWYKMQLKLANKIIFNKWREALGGNIIGIFAGAAALPEHLGKLFSAAGINVREGYGLTEASPVISANRFPHNQVCFGTVGPTLPNVQVRIAEDGEILAKGPNVMMGYYKRPDLTAEAIDKDGWLHTGDVGEMFEGKFLKITDRKKELFKLSGGKYIAPQAIESKYKQSFFIEQIMAVGVNKKSVGALIVPAFPQLEQWLREQNIAFTNREEILHHPEVIQKYREIRDQVNENFSQHEQVKRFALLPNEWSVDTGELTPTMKLKRKVIMDRYHDIIETL